jgi:hypothetical protein
MTEKYVHHEPGAKVESISGHYMVRREERVGYRGREVLVLFGYGVIEHSCCGSGAGCCFARVPGYVVEWRTEMAEDGAAVSVVEPVSDEAEMAELADMIGKMEMYCQVNFD